MSVAIRAITRLVDADDVNVTLGVGVDEYALCWDNDTAKFVLRALSAGVTDHGALTGLSDDDHTGYALLAGRAGGQTLYGGTDANDDITIHGTSNATRTTSYVILQPTAGNVGIRVATPQSPLHVAGDISIPGASAIVFDATASAAGDTKILRTSDNYLRLILDGNNMMDFTTTQARFFVPFNINGNLGISDATSIRVTTANADDIIYLDCARVAIRDTSNSFSTAFMVYNDKVAVGGNFAPSTLLHTRLTSAATNAITNVITIGHESTGTPAAGFGAGLLFQLESSTTASQDAARIQALWYEATHATRKADLVLTAYDTAEREGLRIRGAGSAAAIGFLGAAPAARIAHVADPSGGATVDAEARSAINSILATLENFGLHATS